ncbi:MAG: hypothetical protein O8C61_10525 [Candidatus Methanoperedens sp.]|nr:hypothetical protein [Candidatus Methanoperedens sp.]
MDIEIEAENIYLKNKVISKLDLFVVDFINILKKYTDYVVVSGYVSILFGRSRGTEDIDLLINKIDMDTFLKFHNELIENNYWFLNAENPIELFGMLEDGLAIRAAVKDNVIPNIEIKFVKNQLDRISLKEHKVAQLDTYGINISPLELQIAFKLYLGSDKDIEDAAYLCEIFSAHLSKFKIKHFMDILGVKREDYGFEI